MCVLKYHNKTYYFVLIYTGCKRKKERERDRRDGSLHWLLLHRTWVQFPAHTW